MSASATQGGHNKEKNGEFFLYILSGLNPNHSSEFLRMPVLH